MLIKIYLKEKILKIKMILKYLIILIFIFLMYLLIGSIIPSLINRNVETNTKKAVDNTNFYNKDKIGPDKATIIETPTDSLSIRMELIKSAKKSIDITTYKIADSESTRAFLGEIVKSANKGVKINLILDGKSYFYGKNNDDFLQAMNSHENINCKIYNPVNLLKPWELQFLLHDKIIIVDDEYLLLGGRNIDERHFAPKGFEGPITNDREVFLYNNGKNIPESGIYQAKEYFNSLWSYANTEDIDSEDKNNYLDLLMSTTTSFKNENEKFYKKNLNDFIKRSVNTNKVTLIHNPIENRKKEPIVGYILGKLSLDAKESVILQTPYATGNKNLLNIMTKVSNNAALKMQTNSPYSSPNIAAFSNYYGHRKKFIETGAEIYEYQSKDSIHGKSLVIDDELAIVGSCNMDDRSFYLDTETMLVIHSEELSKELSSNISNLQKDSLIVGKDNKYEESDTVEEKEVSFLRKILLKIVYIIFRPIQYLI